MTDEVNVMQPDGTEREVAGRRSLPAAIPDPGVLRATRAYLLPAVVREGLELALGEVCEIARDEGMHELQIHPVLALARALGDDLEAALSQVGELEAMVVAGSLDREELAAVRGVGALQEHVTPHLDGLRRLLAELQPLLDRLQGSEEDRPGEAPPTPSGERG